MSILRLKKIPSGLKEKIEALNDAEQFIDSLTDIYDETTILLLFPF